MTIGTEQEAFWQGSFGNEYTDRNRGKRWVAANAALFVDVLSRTGGIRSVSRAWREHRSELDGT